MAEFGFLKRKRGFGTSAVHAGHDPSSWPSGDIITPICTSVSYQQVDVGKNKAGYGYSRFGNPTRLALEKALATLSEANYALVFSSGMASLVSLTHILSSGDHVLIADDLYGGSPKYLLEVASRLGIVSSFFDPTVLSDVEKEIRPETKLVWFETPTNPMTKIIDVKELSRRVHAVRSDILVCVDNTFMTSYFQLPLELGADIAMASLTKYYNGHCDVTMGALCVRDEELYKRLHYVQKTLGIIPSPVDCSLVHRSLRTLPLRMERHMRNAIAVARFLEKHPRINKVLHPVLESHPQGALARQQSYGHSGMMAFYVNGTFEETSKFLRGLKVFTLAGSLGDVGSLIAMPIKMIDLPKCREGDTETYNHQLIRMSVGLEEADDLVDDLAQALDKAFQAEE